jgi:uncharacterized protein (TIGR02266 family)
MMDREARGSCEEATFTQSSVQPETRKHPRYRVDLDVTLVSDHNFYAGFVENLSAGGVFIATHMLKPVGERIDVSINLPDCTQAICGLGEVRWVREFSENSNVPPGVGIRFLELAPDAQVAIEQFLQGREPLFWDDE